MTDYVTLTIGTALVTPGGLANGKAVLSLTVADVDPGHALVVPADIEVDLDATGTATTRCFANASGTQGSQLVVKLYDALGKRQFRGVGTVPIHDCNLWDILDQQPTPPLSDAQAAENAAQAAAALAQNWATKTDAEVVVGQGYGAKKYSQDAQTAASSAQAVLADAGFIAVKNDLPNIDTVAGIAVQVNAVAGDHLSIVALANDLTNVDALVPHAADISTLAPHAADVSTAAANIAAIQAAPTYAAGAAASDADAAAQAANANAFALSAAAQAALSYTYSLSSASAVQQDLSAITQQLHYSPNNILGCLFYDTGKDSNPAWVDQVSNASYMQEALNGTWLVPTSPDGWQSELDARSRGATLGAEVCADPTFASAVGWTLDASAAIAGNTLTATATANATAIARRADPVGGNLALATAYQCTVVVASLAAGALTVRLGNTTSVLRTLKTPGTYTFTVNPGATGANLGLYAAGVTTATVTRFSIKPVTASTTATGSYFNNATDGKHYSLNAGAGVTQTTNGNSNKPPRIMAIVWEAGYLVIYDPTKVGCPMWKSFLCTATTSAIGAIAVAAITSNGVWAKEGKLWVGTNQGGLMVDFANDKMLPIRSGASAYILSDRRIAARNAQPSTVLTLAGVLGIDGWSVSSNGVQCITGCTLPDAPVDPNTGLMQPTVLVSHAAGASVLKDDGSGTVSVTLGGIQFAAITPWYVLLGSSANSSLLYALGSPRNLAANFSTTTLAANATQFNDVNNSGLIAANRSLVAKFNSAAPCLELMRFNASNPLASLFAKIGPTYNTGYRVGDVRGCWMADTGTGAVTTTIADYTTTNNPLTVTGSLVKSAAAAGAQMALWTGWSAANYASQAYSAALDPGTAGVTECIWFTIPTNVAAAGTAIDRSAAAGASYTFGHDATGKLTATVFDGTTTRTATSAVSYATGQLYKGRMSLSPSGTLTISVDGAPVVNVTGAPLLSLNNAAAVLTVGNRRALDQPWAGGLALVKIGVTIPTREQSMLCYEQEKMLFGPGAICALPDATALQDFAFDPSQQKLKSVSSGYESSLIGLTFSAQAAVSAGTFTRCAHLGGMRMTARATTNPGVDIMIPAYALREELANRDRAAAERAHPQQCLDYTGGFTATTTNGSSALTVVSGWTFPSHTNPRGEVLTGSGVPASASITDVVGATTYMSAAATVGASNVQIALTDFALPAGYEATDVFAGGSLKIEGATKDYTRLFDGFRETLRFGAAPGFAAPVHINARRYAQ